MSINPSQYKIHLICTYIRNNNDKLEVEYQKPEVDKLYNKLSILND